MSKEQCDYTGEDWADCAPIFVGRPVRVVFDDPFWFRGEVDLRHGERPVFEVFGRVGEIVDDGFAVVALNCDKEPSEREGQFVYWSLVREVEVLG